MSAINSPWSLRIVKGDATAAELEATPGLSIGRHPDCGLTLSDSRVSARHAMIVERGAYLAIVDLGSNNGTCINGSRVLNKDEEQILIGGMRIQLGHVELEVVAPSADSTASDHELMSDTVAGGSDLGDLTVCADLEEPGAGGATQWADGASGNFVSDSDETKMAPEHPRSPAAPPPAPTPAPAPAPAPKPAASSAPPAPAVKASSDSFSAFDSVELNTIIANPDHLVGAQSKLASMGARLVVLNEADLRIVPLHDVEFTIGRSADSSLQLKNRGVSTQHARIVFVAAGSLFMLEDLGSANGTQISGAPLVSGAPRELEPDTHLRFGTIEAVFMQTVDSDFHEFPKGQHESAARLLKARGKVSANVIKQAAKEATERGQTLGEALLLGQHVTARDWCLAVRDARMASTLADLSGGGSRPWWILVLLLVLVAAAFLLGLPQGRELIGLSKP